MAWKPPKVRLQRAPTTATTESEPSVSLGGGTEVVKVDPVATKPTIVPPAIETPSPSTAVETTATPLPLKVSGLRPRKQLLSRLRFPGALRR